MFGEKKIADGGQVDPARDVKVIFCSYILTNYRVPIRRTIPNKHLGGRTFLKFVRVKNNNNI